MNNTYHYPAIYKDMANQTHLLIAGATGSGKSTVIKGIIFSLLLRDPTNAQLVLIDPKRVELVDYKNTTNCIGYACKTPDCIGLLHTVCDVMDDRYRQAQRRHQKQFTGRDIYVIIDEYADLITGSKKVKTEVEETICRLTQLGRAAGIHVILATQRPTSEVITGRIKVNLDSQVALHCINRQDSRNIINIPGAETLPRHGECYYYTPSLMQAGRYTVPLLNEYDFQTVLKERKRQRSIFRRKL